MKKRRWHRIINVVLALALVAVPAVALLSQPAYASPAWYSLDWSYRKKITIDHAKVLNTDQTNFPVLINRTDTDWRYTDNSGHVAQSDGGDILFTNSSGTKLDHEIEKYTASTGELIAWVEVDSLSASSDTDIYIYYGNSSLAEGENQWNVTGTWDSNYKMVQHLEETSGTHEDSTLNNNDGTASGGLNQDATGQINGADDFDGNDDYIEVAHDASLDITDNLTIEMWIKPDVDADKVLIHKFNAYSMEIFNDGSFGGYIEWAGGEPINPVESDWDTGRMTAGTWNHIVFRYENSAGEMELFLNGTNVGINNSYSGDIRTSDIAVFIGSDDTPNCFFDGTIDEVRVSNTARSADWVQTSYNNQSDPGAFCGVGSEETPAPSAPTVTNSSGASNITSSAARLNGEVTDTGGEDPTVHIYWGDNDGGTTPTYWANNVNLGAKGAGTFFTDITGLTLYTTYYYRCYAVNSAGSDWADSTQSFNTGWYDTSWSYRKKITIDHAKVLNTDQTNFPVLINRTDTDWRYTDNSGHVAQSDGGDILFTSSDGTTKLDHEIEKYVPSTGELIAWVEVPAVSASVDTEIYIYYGYAAASDQWNVTGTWDSNYKMVQHLEETSGHHMDSTENDNDSTTESVTTQGSATGKIDGADDFDGSDDNVRVSDSASLDISPDITIEMWIKPDILDGSRVLIHKFEAYSMEIWDDGSFGGYIWKPGGDTIHVESDWDTGRIMTAGTWNHIVFRYEKSAGEMELFLNGTAVGTVETKNYSGDIRTSTIAVFIGSDDTPSCFFDGTIDEVRVSNTARSDDWVQTSYNNQSDPGAFCGVGGEETPIQAPTVTTANATSVDETTATLNGTITDDSGEACQYRFEYDTDSGEPYTSNTGWTGSITTGQSFNANITGLSKGTKYYFRAQTNNTAGTSSGSELTFLTKPDAPTAFSATTASSTQIDLSWTKGNGANRTKIQRKEGSYPANKDDGTEVYFGTGASTSDTGLSPGMTYYYRAWSEVTVTGSQQWSDGYAEASAATPPVEQISDLIASNVAQNSVDLTWTTPAAGTFTYRYFDVRYSPAAITSDNWGNAARVAGEPAPVAGASQGMMVRNLSNDTEYYFAMKLVDDQGNMSLLSNIAGATTLTTAPTDTTPPSAITDLAASAGTPSTTSVILSWTAKGDDETDGIASTYIIKRSTSEITAANFDSATTVYNDLTPKANGDSESFTVSRLSANTTYYFAIKIQDEVPNTSAISNVVNIATANLLPTVTDISPTTGDNGEARTLTITGTNFISSGTTVVRLISDDNTFHLTNVTYVSPTQLTATVPLGAPTGTYKARVINDNGTSALSSATYIVTAAPTPLPVVTNLIPQMTTSNTAVSGVQIFGENLSDATAVRFGDTTATSFTVISDTKITADVPGLTAGEYDVKVTTPAGTNSISAVRFKVSAPVVVNTDTTEDTTTSEVIDLGDTNVTPVQITLTTDTSETATQATDTDAEIEVVIPPQTTITDSEGNDYTGNINPPRVVKPDESVLTDLADNAVVIEMGNPEKTINFDQDCVARLVLTSSTQPLIWYFNKDSQGYELAGKTGTKDGIDYVPGGTKLGQDGNIYTMGLLLDHMSPYISGVNPSITSAPASATPGENITITGTNFDPVGAEVYFDATISSIISKSLTEIVVTTPAFSGNYTVTLKVENSDKLSDTRQFTLLVVFGGGGGGAPAPPPPPPGVRDVSSLITVNGVFTHRITILSAEGLAQLTLAKSTQGLTANRFPLSEISIIPMEEPPYDPPQGAIIIGLVYDIGPDGATFDPPIFLTFNYDERLIPPGAAEADLVPVRWDEEAGGWVALEFWIVDPETNTITGLVRHFTPFTILAYIHPIAFATSDILVIPTEVNTGETVNIITLVTNTSGQSGIYEVTLKINGAAEASTQVTIDAGDSALVSFSTTKDTAGTYLIEVNGLTGSFTVKEGEEASPTVTPPTVTPPTMTPPINWPVLGGIIAGVVIVVVLLISVVRREKI